MSRVSGLLKRYGLLPELKKGTERWISSSVGEDGMQMTIFDRAEVRGYNPFTGNYRLRLCSDAMNHTPGEVVFRPISQIYKSPTFATS